MRRPIAFFPIALALGAIILAPVAARAQDSRQEGPIEIDKCRTINKPGSYRVINNLTSPGGDCLVINADFVTVDLGGFLISGSGTGTAILAQPGAQLRGLAVRSGSIAGFYTGVNFDNDEGSIVQRLRVLQISTVGIVANGIVTENFVADVANGLGIVSHNNPNNVVTKNVVTNVASTGIGIWGTLQSNTVTGAGAFGIDASVGSTVIGNTAMNNNVGIVAACPVNLIDNTAVNNNRNLILNDQGCNVSNTLAP